MHRTLDMPDHPVEPFRRPTPQEGMRAGHARTHRSLQTRGRTGENPTRARPSTAQRLEPGPVRPGFDVLEPGQELSDPQARGHRHARSEAAYVLPSRLEEVERAESPAR